MCEKVYEGRLRRMGNDRVKINVYIDGGLEESEPNNFVPWWLDPARSRMPGVPSPERLF